MKSLLPGTAACEPVGERAAASRAARDPGPRPKPPPWVGTHDPTAPRMTGKRARVCDATRRDGVGGVPIRRVTGPGRLPIRRVTCPGRLPIRRVADLGRVPIRRVTGPGRVPIRGVTGVGRVPTRRVSGARR